MGRRAKARESSKVGGGRAKEKALSMGLGAGVDTLAPHSDRPWPHAFKTEGYWDRRCSRRCDRTIRRVGYCRDAHRSSSRDRLVIPGILAWALDAQLALRAEHLPERRDAHSVRPFSLALVVPGSPQLLTNIHRAIVILLGLVLHTLRVEREGMGTGGVAALPWKAGSSPRPE